ncbi:MAG: acyltransferase [Alistipes sp.]|nr:acyltransferase [Alistipes sp.]
MISTDDILNITTEEEFDRAAMAIFRRQACECEPYRDYLELIGVTAAEVTRVEDIPFLPIELFKTHRVYCGTDQPEAVFTSSSTSGEGVARHYVARAAHYEKVYTRGFEFFYGPAARWSIFALLPSYLEREGSSLVRMVDGLIRAGSGNVRGGFYLYDHEKLLADMASDPGPKILLGVSYALLDLADELTARAGRLPEGTIVMETGGMKGRREEMSKEAMHRTLREAFGVAAVHSEYGMAELMSQAYSVGGGIFRTPPWMRIAVRDLTDPFDVQWARGACGGLARHSSACGGGNVRGGINIADLANLDSCAFIQTQDLGTLRSDGSFTIDGRVARSDIRGCNLLVQ